MGGQYIGKTSFKHYIDKIIWKAFAKRLDNQRVIANSRMTAAIYQNVVGSAPRDVIYPPIDTNQYSCKSPEGYCW